MQNCNFVVIMWVCHVITIYLLEIQVFVEKYFVQYCNCGKQSNHKSEIEITLYISQDLYVIY